MVGKLGMTVGEKLEAGVGETVGGEVGSIVGLYDGHTVGRVVLGRTVGVAVGCRHRRSRRRR